MNDLNSTLIEGKILKDCEIINEENCRFDIVSNRFYQEDKKIKTETTIVKVEAISKLAKTCIPLLIKNKSLRIIGRLKMLGSEIIIAAEHIEFRPEFDNQKLLFNEGDDNE